MMNHDIEVAPARSLSSVEDTSSDSNLAATQFEAIIRAWKGETVEGAVPASPVGEVDWDGNLGLGQLDPSKLARACDYLSLLDVTFLCSFECATWHVGCTTHCTVLDPTCWDSCQVA